MLKEQLLDFNLEGEEWIKAQNDALNFLNQKHKDNPSAVKQSMILELAKNAYIEMKRNEIFQADLGKENLISFVPLLEKVEFTIDKLHFTFKKFYFDSFNEVELDFKPSAEFEYDKDYESKIAEFIESFVKSYKFYIDVDRAIQNDDIVVLDAKISQNDQTSEQKIQVKANENAQTPVEKEILGLTKGDSKTIEKDGFRLEVKVLQVKEEKNMPITDETVHLLNMPDVKTLEDAKKVVRESTANQIFTDALFEYGQKILQEIQAKNPVLEIPNELLLSTLKDQNVPETERKEVLEGARKMISQFFWSTIVQKKMHIRPSDDEMRREIKLVQSFLNEKDPNKIDLGKVAFILTMKKLGLAYLKKYDETNYKLVNKMVQL
ncbi:trigger factor-related chaperone [Mycoplasmopsis glycophila]|uniref:Uncharacterized protein n=1 Tax=Mycoplasmopsis glycophila TaxID=171285 RepID=A0A449AUC1_9BACT|nr:hypothetical protein [Mycoplasmopsis glycophila]VEU70070.1 Uncharacterised protein [Mycoplasmopsis glycophila]